MWLWLEPVVSPMCGQPLLSLFLWTPSSSHAQYLTARVFGPLFLAPSTTISVVSAHHGIQIRSIFPPYSLHRASDGKRVTHSSSRARLCFLPSEHLILVIFYQSLQPVTQVTCLIPLNVTTMRYAFTLAALAAVASASPVVKRQSASITDSLFPSFKGLDVTQLTFCSRYPQLRTHS
jgi:hypothetical protein